MGKMLDLVVQVESIVEPETNSKIFDAPMITVDNLNSYSFQMIRIFEEVLLKFS